MAALTIPQILKFNSTKHKQGPNISSSGRHNISQETPVPLYIGLLLHAKTRKRELVERMTNFGLSVLDHHFLDLTKMRNKVCDLYQSQQLVCPPQLRSHVFTIAAVDNIDHNSHRF